METLDKKDIQDFYETVQSVWPPNDKWHKRTQYEICKYINKKIPKESGIILNAGSGGSTYGLTNEMIHVDIAASKIVSFRNSLVANIEALPFEDEEFPIVICVGSVLNYCDAAVAIAELTRVLQHGGVMILEFECSGSYEFMNTQQYQQPCTIVTTRYFDSQHKLWVFSEDYIKSLFHSCNLNVRNIHRFHILSSLDYYHSHNENHAALFTKLDWIARRIHYFSKHAANMIFYAIRM